MTEKIKHRGWTITFEYPPIPIRDFDYIASDPNGDGCPVANGATIDACKEAIDQILLEREEDFL